MIGLVDFSSIVNSSCRCWSQNSELTIMNLARAREAAVWSSVSGYFAWLLHTATSRGPNADSSVFPIDRDRMCLYKILEDSYGVYIQWQTISLFYMNYLLRKCFFVKSYTHKKQTQKDHSNVHV